MYRTLNVACPPPEPGGPYCLEWLAASPEADPRRVSLAISTRALDACDKALDP